MAFNNTNLVLPILQTDFGGYYWTYSTTDGKVDIEDGGYFNGAFGRVRAGDIIHVTDDDGSRIYCVTTAASPNNVIINGPVETL